MIFLQEVNQSQTAKVKIIPFEKDDNFLPES